MRDPSHLTSRVAAFTTDITVITAITTVARAGTAKTSYHRQAPLRLAERSAVEPFYACARSGQLL